MTADPENRRVLMLALDAAEISLVRRWTADGSMPVLRRLCEDGGLLPLKSPAAQFVGSPWPSFFMSQSPAEHGMYHFLVWRPDQLRTSRPSRSWLALRPFWRHLARNGTDVVAVDIPQAYAPEPHPGRELSGWATHEILEPPASQPPEFLDWVKEKFGQPPFDDEASHPLTADEALAVRDQCIETTRLVGNMGANLMRTESWNLFLLCFAATHRAGHQLWDRTSLSGHSTESDLAEFDDALRQVYVAADNAVGQMIDCADEDTAVLVFALHGMEANRSRTILTAEMLNRILSGSNPSQTPARVSPVDRLRNAVPIRWRSVVKRRLPIFMQDWLSVFWRLRGIDWSTTRAFAQFGDLDAYVRVNLRGREAEGIVEPGSEYTDLCQQIADGFRTFVDEDTGERVVDGIEFVADAFPEGEHRDNLPDLIIHWARASAALHRRIVSADFGTIDWPTPGYHPQGRSGDHARNGFLLSRGFGISAANDEADILDLAPTIYDLLRVEQPREFQGRSLLAQRK